MSKTVFLDRDGVINRRAPEHEYIKEWCDFEFLPGVVDGVRMLNDANFRVVVVTNQRGISRGMLSLQDVDMLHKIMCTELEIKKAQIDQICVCPHEIGTCRCRKPDIGLFIQAEQEKTVDKGHSFMVGDSESDIQAGRRYGVRTIMIGYSPFSDFCCDSLLKAARIILEEEGCINTLTNNQS